MKPQQELTRYYKWLREYGYNDSHSGNISVRNGDAVLITPTSACADTLLPEDFVTCGIDAVIPAGASGDAALHIAVYQRNAKANAMIHSHGAYSIAMTLNGEDFVPVDFEGQLYFPKVPVITVPYETYFADAAAKVAEVLAEYPVCIVRGHGVYAQAEHLNLAYKWTCSLELSAKTVFLAKQAGTVAKASV